MSTGGIFTISLDFELYWGMLDKVSLEDYRENLTGGRKAIPQMLELFQHSGIHATWATVGFLFCQDLAELRREAPASKPAYRLRRLCPFRYLDENDALDPQFHVAPELIDLIRGTPGQEVGTHTFSHYYCLEQGQTKRNFNDDIAQAVALAARRGIALRSLVFPRNQWNPEYLPDIAAHGIRCFRGNPSGWMYRASPDEAQHPLQRMFRLIDNYINLTGHHTYFLGKGACGEPFNIPASRFLRPYSPRLAMIEEFRLRRITRAMDDAARQGRLFHLWWHPHNFGRHLKENMTFLRQIVAHFTTLERRYGMTSLNMGEIADWLTRNVS